ncbi:MAG: FtsW/RodA/SpoVE family cell cycle protein [Clostridiales Family XIII bacterium]|jgi:rod shape determining protein RodA|nr:FtsW/RodA/SpoVE family cell cycle protein [Clostridiales Family XIII bacterium]
MSAILEIFRRIDKILILLPLAFAIISIGMISSITATAADPIGKQVITQTVAYALGFGLLVAVVAFDYKRLLPFKWVLYGMAILIQLTVYIPGLGVEMYGSRAWIDIFGITTVQPSEIVKVFYILCLAIYLTEKKKDLATFKGFLLCFAYALPIIGIVAVEDMGAGIVMMFIFVGMVFAAGMSAGLFLRLAALFIISVPVLYRFMAPHQKERFSAFLHPENLSIDATYQVFQSKVAIGSGGFFGKGFRDGVIKQSGLIPVQESDFIFPIICEEFGMLGGVIVIALYALLILRIWRTVARSTEIFGALICVGFMCLFGFQLFENIGMTMGVMPVTGITLPFLSAGGSSILANMLGLGLVIGVGMRDTSKQVRYL